jgi:hypothetical protein
MQPHTHNTFRGQLLKGDISTIGSKEWTQVVERSFDAGVQVSHIDRGDFLSHGWNKCTSVARNHVFRSYFGGAMHRSSVALIVCLTGSLVKGQLGGTYMVGPGGDLPDLEVAVQSAEIEGLGSSTTFVVLSGGEPQGPVVLGMIPGSGPSSVLSIVSAEPDPASIQLDGVYFQGASYIILEGFQINSSLNPTYAALSVSQCHDVELRRCQIVENGNANYGVNEALINLQQSGSPAPGPIRFEECQAASTDMVIRAMGQLGVLSFSECVLEGPFNTWGGTRQFEHCLIRTTSSDHTGNAFFRDCTFGSPNGHIDLKAGLIENCTFECNTYLTATEVRQNAFRNLRMSFGNYLVAGNTADTATFTYTHGSKLIGNHFRGPVVASGDNQKVINNSFSGKFQIPNGPGQVVQYNNFGPEGIMDIGYCGGVFEFNSIWDLRVEAAQHASIQLRRNNYASNTPSTIYHASYDQWATFHDPQFDGDAPYWHATNPLLSGKANYFNVHGAIDIDSVPRTLPAATSANIICWGQLSFPDSLLIPCGEQLAIRPCALEEGLWIDPLSPSGIIDMAVLPTGASLSLYLMDSTGTRLDSCWISRITPPSLPTVQLYAYCGFPVEMNAFLPWFADSLNWSPGVFFEDPSLAFQTVQSDTSVLLVSTAFSAACGDQQQYFQLNIAPTPVTFFTNDQIGNNVFLEAFTGCCDSIRWDLGDGTYSTDPELRHTYSSNGSYLVTLTCWLETDTGVTFTYISVTTTGLEELIDDPFSVHPNPTIGIIRLSLDDPSAQQYRLQILDLSGRTVLERNEYLPTTLDLGQLSNGAYLIRLESTLRSFQRTIIVQRE